MIEIGPDPLHRAGADAQLRDRRVAGRPAPTPPLAALSDALDRIVPRGAEKSRQRGTCRIPDAPSRKQSIEKLLAAGKGKPMNPAWVSHCLSEAADDNTTFFNELGVDPSVMSFSAPKTFFSSPLSGGLGWGMPAALGAQYADRTRQVIACVGDGSYMFANPVALPPDGGGAWTSPAHRRLQQRHLERRSPLHALYVSEGQGGRGQHHADHLAVPLARLCRHRARPWRPCRNGWTMVPNCRLPSSARLPRRGPASRPCSRSWSPISGRKMASPDPEARHLARLRSRFPTVPDLERRAAWRIPRFAFDFIQGGAGDESGLSRNRAALNSIEIVPRYGVDATRVDTSTELFRSPLRRSHRHFADRFRRHHVARSHPALRRGRATPQYPLSGSAHWPVKPSRRSPRSRLT